MVSFDDKCAFMSPNFIEGKLDYTLVFAKLNELIDKMSDENTEVSQ